MDEDAVADEEGGLEERFEGGREEEAPLGGQSGTGELFDSLGCFFCDGNCFRNFGQCLGDFRIEWGWG